MRGAPDSGPRGVGSEGGTDEAKARWQEGAEQTKETAHEGGAETKKRSKVPRCK